MQITKLEDGRFQILTTEIETAPSGDTFTRTSVDVVSLQNLQDQASALSSQLTSVQSKIDAIAALPQ